MFEKIFLIFISLVFLSSISSEEVNLLDDYSIHPCIRDCDTANLKPMRCIYNFTIEWYSVLSRNCFDCVNNSSDCYKPHCVTANGVKRAIKTVNRILPGPSIQVCKGDQVIVNAYNNLHSFEATTIHWHGLKQKGSNHMDGVGMITQCPITPHTRFEYSFLAEDVGTHLWHAHSAGQRADGIFGAIVVRSPKDVNANLYDFDLKDHVVVVNDWMDQSIISKYTAFLHDFGDEAINGILINGKGIDVLPARNKLDYQTPRAVFHVEKNKRYRFRMINAGVQYCPLQVSIDGHNLTLIATDGNPIEPIQVTSFYILAGERVDFVINANRDIDNYWIRIKGHADCEETEVYQTGILRYHEANEILPDETVDYESSGPLTEGPTFNPFNTEISEKDKEELIAVDEIRSIPEKHSKLFLEKIKEKPNKKFYLSLDMNIVKNTEVYDDTTFEAEGEPEQWASPQINNATFHMPTSPLVFQKFPIEHVCDAKKQLECQNDAEKFCKCLHTLEVDMYDVVEVIVADGGSQEENHPIHLHGQSFAVVGIEKLGEKVFMPDLIKKDEQDLLKRNLINPPLKDTVTVPSGGYTIFRFYAENPGIWFMHCHVEFHSESGMALIFKVGNEKSTPQAVKPDNWPTCGDFVQPNTFKDVISSSFKLNYNLFIIILSILMCKFYLN